MRLKLLLLIMLFVGCSNAEVDFARSLAVPYYFCLVNLAGVVGFCRVVAGNVQGTWTPVRSA